MNNLEGFFSILWELLIEVGKKLGTFLLNDFFQERIKLKIYLVKAIFLMWYSDKNSFQED